MSRLPDEILDDCLCRPDAPLAGDPARQYGLDKARAQERLAEIKEWLRERLTMLRANRREALLLILQGPDCSGKDGVIRRVLAGLDPRALAVHGFQPPSDAERAHDFLWRYRQRLPAPGQLGVFDRSWYEGLISDPLDGLCGEDEVPARLERVLALEERLPAQGIAPLKCYLQISRHEQKRRLHQRLEQIDKRWKLAAGDLEAHRQFDLRQARWSTLLAASHRPPAPWYVIPADHRWLRDLLLASLLARELEKLDLDWPQRPPPFTADELERA
jgi:polyphosphate kinase 2 (PPK2 family)